MSIQYFVIYIGLREITDVSLVQAIIYQVSMASAAQMSTFTRVSHSRFDVDWYCQNIVNGNNTRDYIIN